MPAQTLPTNAEREEQRQVILDLYYTLHRAYRLTFGPDAAPNYMLDQLLPEDNLPDPLLSDLDQPLRFGTLLPIYCEMRRFGEC